MITLEVDTTALAARFERLLRYSKRSAEAEFTTCAKGIVNNAFLIIPPAAGKNQGLTAARSDGANLARGQMRLLRDLRGVFAPNPLRGRRQITKVFGRVPAQPIFVPTREKYPDVGAVYADRSARRHGGRLTRGGRAPYFVDAAKFNTLAQTLESRVGNAASGFGPAARLLRARIPGYARGHSQSGGVVFDVQSDSLRFRMDNTVPYAGSLGDIQRRMQWAVDEQARKIQRQLPHIIRAAGREAGFAST